MMSRERPTFRWWYLPSWLGLDAPCVVSTWCFAIARASNARVESTSIAVLFLVVWAIYLTDRLVDVARCSTWTHVSGRMQFGRDSWRVFVVCLAGCVGALAMFLADGLPFAVVWRGIFVALGMTIYFALYVLPMIFRDKLPGKEFGVGLFFALGCYCVLGVELRTVGMFIGVALLVAYNCLVIAARDRDVDRDADRGAASRWWPSIDRDLTPVGVALIALAVLGAVLGSAPWFYMALALAQLLLVNLHRRAAQYSSDSVRALADFCLLTPWLFILLQGLGAGF